MLVIYFYCYFLKLTAGEVGIVFPECNLLCNLFLDEVHIQQCVKLHQFFQSFKCSFLVLEGKRWIGIAGVIKDIEISEITCFLCITRYPWRRKFKVWSSKVASHFFIIIVKPYERLFKLVYLYYGLRGKLNEFAFETNLPKYSLLCYFGVIS